MHLCITNGWRPAQLNKALSGNRMTLSLVNISVSLNNADCHLLFILLLSLQPSLFPLPICVHTVWIDFASYVSIFLSSHHLPTHLPSSLCASTFSTSLDHYLKCLLAFSHPPLPYWKTWGPWKRQRSHDDSDVEGVQRVDWLSFFDRRRSEFNI